MSKLSWTDVEDVRELLDAHVAASGIRDAAREIGARYGVTGDVILELYAGRSSSVAPLRTPKRPAPEAPRDSARWLGWQAVEQHGSAQKLAEIVGLLGLLMSREPPRNVLEIGGYRGGTLWAFDQLRAKPGKLVCVDLLVMDGRLEGAAGVDYELVGTDSHDPATLAAVKEAFAGELVDLLFIDGDHTLEGATADWEMYGPLVRPGGIAAFHDTGMPHAESPETHNVIPLWERLEREHDTLHIFGTHDEGHWGGIGVVFL